MEKNKKIINKINIKTINKKPLNSIRIQKNKTDILCIELYLRGVYL